MTLRFNTITDLPCNCVMCIQSCKYSRNILVSTSTRTITALPQFIVSSIPLGQHILRGPWTYAVPVPFLLGLEVDLWSSLYWFSPQLRCPYRGHFLSSYSSFGLYVRFSQWRYATGRRTFIGTVFHSTRFQRPTATTSDRTIARKSRVILYDCNVNLSVLIPNSTGAGRIIPNSLLFLYYVDFSFVRSCPT